MITGFYDLLKPKLTFFTIKTIDGKHFNKDGMHNLLDLCSLPDTSTSHGAPPLCFFFTDDEVFEIPKNLDSSQSPGPD